MPHKWLHLTSTKDLLCRTIFLVILFFNKLAQNKVIVLLVKPDVQIFVIFGGPYHVVSVAKGLEIFPPARQVSQ